MGNSESSSQYPYSQGNNTDPNQLKWKDAEEEEGESAPSAAGKALKVGAAVAGTALLALGALTLASSSSSDSTGNQAEKKKSGQTSGLVEASSFIRRGTEAYIQPHDPHDHYGSRTIKIMSYNVWFREDVELIKRMEAIGQLIEQHEPDVIFFQEVTPNIYRIFHSSEWWRSYRCSVPPGKATRSYFCMLLSRFPVKSFIDRRFENSNMGREICTAELDFKSSSSFVVATSHLESPTPPEMNSTKRVSQMKEAISNLNFLPNVVFGGDMNWDEAHDGPLPLHGDWVDAWKKLRPAENGWTYDTKANQSLRGYRPLQKRLDRFLCKLRDFEIADIDMIGMEAIPGVSYYHRNKLNPVYPSDHFGMLLTISEKSTF